MLKYLQDILHNRSILGRLTWQLLLYKSINGKLAQTFSYWPNGWLYLRGYSLNILLPRSQASIHVMQWDEGLCVTNVLGIYYVCCSVRCWNNLEYVQVWTLSWTFLNVLFTSFLMRILYISYQIFYRRPVAAQLRKCLITQCYLENAKKLHCKVSHQWQR